MMKNTIKIDDENNKAYLLNILLLIPLYFDDKNKCSSSSDKTKCEATSPEFDNLIELLTKIRAEIDIKNKTVEVISSLFS
jgi:hypothetical protein